MTSAVPPRIPAVVPARFASTGFPGKIIAVIETEYDSIGVDTPEDLERVRDLFKQRQAHAAAE